jgi:hypothetical protein
LESSGNKALKIGLRIGLKVGIPVLTPLVWLTVPRRSRIRQLSQDSGQSASEITEAPSVTSASAETQIVYFICNAEVRL